jgi:hypothetical protein
MTRRATARQRLRARLLGWIMAPRVAGVRHRLAEWDWLLHDRDIPAERREQIIADKAARYYPRTAPFLGRPWYGTASTDAAFDLR